jgi:hypothetical protein
LVVRAVIDSYLPSAIFTFGSTYRGHDEVALE